MRFKDSKIQRVLIKVTTEFLSFICFLQICHVLLLFHDYKITENYHKFTKKTIQGKRLKKLRFISGTHAARKFSFFYRILVLQVIFENQKL